MSELIVIFAACALGLLVAVPQATALYGRTSGQREIDRLLGAVERAGADFLWQEMRLLGFLLALIALAVSMPALIWQSARPLGVSTVTASVLALGAGAIVGGAAARLAHWAAARATAASLAALRPLDGAIGMGHPIVILGGLTGAASLLFHLGSALQISSRAVNVVHGDVGARLECETVERAETAVLPSYRQSIQLAAQAATQSLLRLSALALLPPVLFGVVLRLVFGAGGGRLAAQGLMAYASTAALIGCYAALAAEGVALALRTSCQSPPSRDRGPALDPSSAREFMGRSIRSSALFGLKAAVIASLVIAPLLF